MHKEISGTARTTRRLRQKFPISPRSLLAQRRALRAFYIAPRQQIEQKETKVTKFLFECPAHLRGPPAQEPLRFLGYLLLKFLQRNQTEGNEGNKASL